MLVLLSACGHEPEKAASFKTIFDYYKAREDIMALSLPPGLLSLVLPEDDPEMFELKKLMGELSAFRMLTVEKNETNAGLTGELRNAVTEFTYRNEFSDLFRMQKGEEDIFIRILEKNDGVKEAILMLSSDSDFFVIDLRGNISMEHFIKLAEGGYLNELSSLADFNL